MRPATTGTVLYDNRDLYQNYNELRYRIGLVPQESVLHTQLTARRALQYSAELRFPADTKADERDGRVDEVMGELGLTRHAQTRADRLSGGQLKRVNVAQELLTKPSLLFLDEPTSGLDPGLDKSVMEQMRDLAHDGRTVIVVTHSVDNLDTCDRLLVLVPGGRIAYYGPPEEGLAYFGQARWAEVFQAFEAYPDRDWAAEYAASPAYAQYVLGRPKPQAQAGAPEAPAAPPPQQRGGFRQMTTLTRRYVRVIASDRGYLLSMVLLPVVLGVLIHFVGTSQGLKGPPRTKPNAQQVLLMLVICDLPGRGRDLGQGAGQGTRDLRTGNGRPGLSSGAYLSSKLIVLGVISIVQSIVLVLLGVAARKLPLTGSFLTHAPLIELLIGIAVLGFTSMCLGPARLGPGQHVGEGDAHPGAAHHGPGHPVRRRASLVTSRSAAHRHRAVSLGVRRGRVHREPQPHQPDPGQLTDPLWDHTSSQLAARHGRHDRAGGALRAVHLDLHAPPRPAPPQVMTTGRT